MVEMSLLLGEHRVEKGESKIKMDDVFRSFFLSY